MTDTLNCPRCVEAVEARGGTVPEGAEPLTLDPETTNWMCQKGHVIQGPEIEAIMTHPEEGETMGKMTKARARNAVQTQPKAAAKTHARDIQTPPQAPAGDGSEMEPAVGESGNGVADAIHGVLERMTGDIAATARVCEMDAVAVTYESVAGVLGVGVTVENGDLVVALAIPEMYAESARQLAEENRQTVVEWAQQRLDFYLENEFTAVRSV